MTKKEMIEYITSFKLYPTMNSWNQAYGYSFNVKVHSLPLTAKEKDALYEIVSDQELSDEFYSDLNFVIGEHQDIINALWNEDRHDPMQHITELYPEKRHKTRCNRCGRPTWYEPGHPCQVAGCKGELIEIKYPEAMLERLRKAQFEIGFNGRSGGHLVLYKWNGYNYGGTGWNHDASELGRMPKDEIARIYEVLKRFEACYQDLLKTSKAYANRKVEDYSEERKITVEGKRFAD